MMRDAHDELRDELMAMLAAGQELPRDTHELLVDRFIGKLETERPSTSTLEQLKLLYAEIVRVHISTVIAVALLQGLPLLVIGDYMLRTVMDLPTYASVYMPAWMMIGLIWVVEVVITLAVLSIQARKSDRRVGARPTSRKTPQAER